jgi:hypothetical protein
MAYALPNSTYYDYNSYFNNATSNGSLSGTVVDTTTSSFSVNVALVLERANGNDPTTLLSAPWASRYQQLEALNANGTLWSTYGADAGDYNQVLTDLAGLGVQTVDQISAATSTPNGYVSSVESRTVWIQLDAAQFNALFSTTLMRQGSDHYFWTGSLQVPDGWQGIVQGLWFDVDDSTFRPVMPASGAPQATLVEGFQGPGNGAAAPGTSIKPPTSPQQIAQYYNFPLAGLDIDTGPIGLLESGLGNETGTSQTFAQLLANYRQTIGLDPNVTVDGLQPGGWNGSPTPERALDVGVATAVNPNSALMLYAGSGININAQSEPFTTYQSAIWDPNAPAVISSSDHFLVSQPNPGSPFLWAAQQLFVDAALHGITLLSSSGDGGSGYEIANGFTNVTYTRSSPYGLVVGGTSLSLESVAATDKTLSEYVDAALAGELQTLWQLVAGGMTATPTADTSQWFIETVWNRYYLDGTTLQPGYTGNESGNGGIDPTQPMPWYQAALTPFTPMTTTDGTNVTGRGVPDVAALSTGNMDYLVPNTDLIGTMGDGGTSAATPLWASLVVQFNAIFRDQGLPSLGYMNDLLYIAAAIAPGSFNDVTVGNNVSSFLDGGTTYTNDGTPMTPTGFGYYAGPGYDLTTGLGSPNGTLLARALTTIGHSQLYFDSQPEVIDSDGGGGWTSGADQTLLVQSMSWGAMSADVLAGGQALDLFSQGTAGFAWTSRFAGQSLQSFFDQQLVTTFDANGQGTLGQIRVGAGQALSVSIDGLAAEAYSAALTSSFGFADFQTAAGTVRLARPVAIAETAGGGDDQTAVVRVRQNGVDDLSVTFYRVDDLSGHIGSLKPGDAGYAAAAQGRAYQLGSGGTALGGPGYGNYEQATLVNVDAGDMIAMVLTNNSSGATYWAFSQANESVGGKNIGHIWNYGANTWGFEDQYGGGDGDFNDLVIQLDFTSAYGSGWLTN